MAKKRGVDVLSLGYFALLMIQLASFLFLRFIYLVVGNAE